MTFARGLQLQPCQIVLHDFLPSGSTTQHCPYMYSRTAELYSDIEHTAFAISNDVIAVVPFSLRAQTQYT